MFQIVRLKFDKGSNPIEVKISLFSEEKGKKIIQ